MDWETLDRLLRLVLTFEWSGTSGRQSCPPIPGQKKNKQYAFSQVISWFMTRQKKGILDLQFRTTTWLCSPDIAAFSDTIFDPAWGFPATE